MKIYAGHLMKRCTDRLIHEAKQLHARITRSPTITDNPIASKWIVSYVKKGYPFSHLIATRLFAARLMTFYFNCEDLSSAHKVFDGIPQKKKASTFNALIQSYSVHEQHIKVLTLFTSFFLSKFERWDMDRVKPSSSILCYVVKAASKLEAYDRLISFSQIHCYAVKNDLDSDVSVASGLLNSYLKCDDLSSARRLFNEIPNKNLVSWNAMISHCCKKEYYKECKNLYRMMLKSQVKPDGVTAENILIACAQSKDLILGEQVNTYIVDQRIQINLAFCNSVIALYAKCGFIDHAREYFDELGDMKDEKSYHYMIIGYMENGYKHDAIKLSKSIGSPPSIIDALDSSFRVWNRRLKKIRKRKGIY